MNTQRHTQSEKNPHLTLFLFYTVSLPSVAVSEVEAC